MSAGQRGERGESVAGLSVLHQLHEMVDAVAQEFLLGVFWHTVDAVIVHDVGIDE